MDSDPDFQRKLAIQRQLINEEEQKKQKEAAALAQQAILLSQRGGSAAAASAPAPPPSGDLMEKVRQQQVMIEMEKQQTVSTSSLSLQHDTQSGWLLLCLKPFSSHLKVLINT